MTSGDSTKRFSNRVCDYVKYRPDYPVEAINYIFENTNLDSQSTIADIGAGTGMLTVALLPNGAWVIAVEPNDEMRDACDNQLSNYPNYESTGGTAEQTGLDDHSVDLITAAQAFHWFNVDRAKEEFQRILKPDGRIVLIWNRRVNAKSGFLSQYEAMLISNIAEYNRVNHANASDEVVTDFLGPEMKLVDFPNHQDFNFEGVKGRLLSSSYCPAVGEDGHAELMAELQKLYDQYEEDGSVRFDYRTQVYIA